MSARSRLPDVLLAGVPKAGTSSLARWLGAHPDVHLPPQKEVHFFDEHWQAGIDWYREHFAGPGRVAVDATPTYALRDERLTRALRTVGDVRLVLLLRHPVERLWSAYWYMRSMGLETRSLPAVVADGIAAGAAEPSQVRAGDYRNLFERIDRCASRVPTLLLLQDDLASDPDAVWAQTCDFLGLAAVPRPTHVGERLNPTGTIRSFQVRYWSMRLHLFRRTPRLAHAVDRWNRTTERPPPMAAALRSRLLEYYAPSVRAVEERLDRALPDWRT